MNNRRNIIFTLLFFMLVLTGCEGIGTADFGDVANGANGGSASGGTSSDLTFSGIDSINQITDATARLNWTNHADAVAYEIYNVTSGTSFIATVMAPATSYDLTGLNPSTAYEYRVRAKDGEGNNDSNTNDVSFTTNLAPDPPSGLALQEPTTTPNFDDNTPTIRISGVKNGDTIKLFTDSSCSSQVGSAVASGTTVDITTSSLAAAAYTFHANATNSSSNASTCSSATVSYTVELCPTGYVAVPENTTLGVSAFCVMQYEAKDDGSGNAISQAGGAPWVSINQTNSKTECTSLGAKYDLISNPEWITITYNVEAQDANWSSGTVGSGCLFRGNNGTADACGYNGADPESGTGRDTKAKHVLSNGEEIWDLAGNVWEWVDWSLGGGLTSGPISCTAAWTELPDVACGALAAADYMPDNPSGQTASTYNAGFGLGRLYGGAGGATLRGGRWNNGTIAGAFTLALNYAPSHTGTSVGFRCVYRP
ncbi:fibronectin type III domain-containing protein [Bacteriovoracaceae bacterium]|nr:fibronectin type III domain-containing protein [Bacteriovoracaceae bacterium]